MTSPASASCSCSARAARNPHLERDPALLTTIKLRVLSRQQQLLRVDFENSPTHEVLHAGLARFDELLPRTT